MELDKVGMEDEALIFFEGVESQGFHGVGDIFWCGVVWKREGGLQGGASEEHFEVVGSVEHIGELLGNGFALNGKFNLSIDRPWGHTFEEAVVFSAPSADGSADSVEDAELDAMFSSYIGEGPFGLVDFPAAGEDTAIFIAIAVSEHDLLELSGFIVVFYHCGMGEESIEDCWGIAEVFDCFEEGYDLNGEIGHTYFPHEDKNDE